MQIYYRGKRNGRSQSGRPAVSPACDYQAARFPFRFLALLTIMSLHAIDTRPSKAETKRYLGLPCHMDHCRWSSILSKMVISKNANGALVGAEASECTTVHKNGRYPRGYSCRNSEITIINYVAFCSNRFPSIAFRIEDRKWMRTKLS